MATRSTTLLLLATTLGLVSCQQGSAEPIHPVPGSAGTGQVASGGDGGADGDGGGALGDGGAGGDAPSAECTALGPFGIDEHETLDPTLSWDGFEAGETQPGTVSLESYALCGDGVDTTAIVIQIDALWCPACKDVAEGLAARNDSRWKPAGVKTISLVIEDEEGQPADVEDAYRWRAQYGLEGLDVAWDPGYSLANEDPDILPQALIVDPSTMLIVARVYGNVDLQPIIDSVVAANQ